MTLSDPLINQWVRPTVSLIVLLMDHRGSLIVIHGSVGITHCVINGSSGLTNFVINISPGITHCVINGSTGTQLVRPDDSWMTQWVISTYPLMTMS
jgi:hypothetical protein